MMLSAGNGQADEHLFPVRSLHMNKYGTPFAVKRYNRYGDVYQWQDHSKYKGFMIQRCYDGSQPKACYRAIDYDRDFIITGEGLLQVKESITNYLRDYA